MKPKIEYQQHPPSERASWMPNYVHGHKGDTMTMERAEEPSISHRVIEDAPPKPLSHLQVLDLNDWKSHRVLAKRGKMFMPGTIAAINAPTVVSVLFDQDQVTMMYKDVTSYCDIIADASPTQAQVSSATY